MFDKLVKIVIIIGAVLGTAAFILYFVSVKKSEKFTGDDARSFTDKIKRRMGDPIWDSDKYVKYVDKILFKDYARGKGVDTLETLSVYDLNNPSIQLSDIPSDCAIKANNSSGRNIIIKDGKIINGGYKGAHLKGYAVRNKWNELLKQIDTWKHTPEQAGEPWYSYIEPKIFIEPLMDPVPTDYKFFVYGGKVKIIQVDINRFGEHCRLYYDTNWKDTGCTDISHTMCSQKHPKPTNLKQMIQVAEKLSDNFDFVRVDLYNYDGKILGGELTFGPGAGNEKILGKGCNDLFSKSWKYK